MPWTVLHCDHIDFSSTQSDNVRGLANDTWETAKISVIALTDHDRWLMVRTLRNPAPTVWRAIKESWIVACDEQSMTMLLQLPQSNELPKTVLKLRFGTLREFWVFAAHSTFARVHAQLGGWGEPTYNSAEQSSLGGALNAPAL
ncbi:hypothetical protein C2E23DRAFT_888946 [Lenzites betulinus]|nr:hypothetical protein C2E23DRAFT_888946 [Lenzites betulinus]